MLINVALWLSRRVTSLNLPQQDPHDGVHMPARVNPCVCTDVGAHRADLSGGPLSPSSTNMWMPLKGSAPQ